MYNCVFCKIVNWETPSRRVYEDEQYIAFLDINPINFGHTLVIPREHYVDVETTPAETLADLIKIVKRLAPAIVKATGAAGYNLTINNGRAAGQAVDHIHMHLIPRFEGDGFQLWHGRDQYSEGAMGEMAKKIKEAVSL